MASIWKRSNSQYFTACFRDQNGNQRRASTKETNRKQAQKIADEYEKAIRTKRTLRQTQKVLDRLHEEISGEKIVRITLRVCRGLARNQRAGNRTADLYVLQKQRD
jgi:hypothetical protein